MPKRSVSISLLLVLLPACDWYNPFEGVGGWVLGALIVADLIIAYDIIQSSRSLGMKVTWVAVVFLIPILGILAYLIFERKRRVLSTQYSVFSTK